MIERNSDRVELWTQLTEALKIAESDFSDYLENLEEEERLARGDVQW